MCTPTTGAGQPHGSWSVPGPAAAMAAAAPEGAVPPALTAPLPAPRTAPRPADPALSRPRLAELRTLRRDAQRDEADLSYVRRLVQGRIDILRAELARRADLPVEVPSGASGLPGGPEGPGGAPGSARGHALRSVEGPGEDPLEAPPGGTGHVGPERAPMAPLVGRLSAILADKAGGRRSVTRSARHVTLGTPHSEEYGRLAAAMLAEVELSDLDARTDDELRTAMGRLVAYEQQVSRRRQQLQHIADDCGAEIARRYREGEAQVDDLLA